ncbi:MAG: EamA family transporter [Clostridia bacterium]|nr:EamA family transporter [Clostridia bacterium]
MKKTNILNGYFFIIGSAILFGCMPLIAKHIYSEGINPISLVVLRNILSLPFLFTFGLIKKESFKVDLKAIPRVVSIGIFGCALTPLLLFYSYNYISGGTATVFHFIYPALVLLLYFLFLKEKMSRSNVVAIIMCVAGIAMFYDPNGYLDPTGAILALLSGLTYALYIFFLGKFGRVGMSNFVFSFYTTSGAAVVLLVVAIVTQSLVLPSSFLGWILCIAFALLINVGAVVLFQCGTLIIGGQKASIMSTLEPITSLVVGFLAFDENISLLSAIGSLFVISASIFIALSKTT